MAYQSPATAVPPVARNGFGIAALVLALIGLVFGLVPLTGFLALILGMLAVLFGSLGWARTRRGEATNPKMTVIGAALGIGAVALGIWGMTIVFGAVDKIGKGLSGQGGAAVTGSDRAEMSAPTEATNQVTFGQSFTYEDGTIITVAAPIPYQPSSTAAMSAGSAHAVAMRVTVTNGTAKPLNLAAASLQAAAGDQATAQIFDSAKGVGMPSQTLPPGKRQTFTVAFSLPAGPSEFRVQAIPSWFGYQPVFFIGHVNA